MRNSTRVKRADSGDEIPVLAIFMRSSIVWRMAVHSTLPSFIGEAVLKICWSVSSVGIEDEDGPVFERYFGRFPRFDVWSNDSNVQERRERLALSKFPSSQMPTLRQA